MPTTLRFPDPDDERAFEAAARVDGISSVEFARHAIARHIERRRDDPEFQARLREVMDENRSALDQLAR